MMNQATVASPAPMVMVPNKPASANPISGADLIPNKPASATPPMAIRSVVNSAAIATNPIKFT